LELIRKEEISILLNTIETPHESSCLSRAAIAFHYWVGVNPTSKPTLPHTSLLEPVREEGEEGITPRMR